MQLDFMPKEERMLTESRKVGCGYNTDDFLEEQRLNRLGHGA